MRPPAPARPAGPGGPPGPGGQVKQTPHVLLRVGGPPLLLIPGQTFTIGREDCSLTIPSSRVSRRHSEIVWEDGHPVIKDLDSSNGTLVGGKRITKPHVLVSGDEISIGPYLCTYQDRRKAPAAAAPDANLLTAPMLADAMAGRLDQVSLFELLQTLDFNQKTGLLEVFGSDASGSIGIREGKPVYAEAEDQVGVEAIYLLLREKDGQFTFGPGFDAARAADVQGAVTAILMEASRRQDEGGGH